VRYSAAEDLRTKNGGASDPPSFRRGAALPCTSPALEAPAIGMASRGYCAVTIWALVSFVELSQALSLVIRHNVLTQLEGKEGQNIKSDVLSKSCSKVPCGTASRASRHISPMAQLAAAGGVIRTKGRTDRRIPIRSMY